MAVGLGGGAIVGSEKVCVRSIACVSRAPRAHTQTLSLSLSLSLSHTHTHAHTHTHTHTHVRMHERTSMQMQEFCTQMPSIFRMQSHRNKSCNVQFVRNDAYRVALPCCPRYQQTITAADKSTLNMHTRKITTGQTYSDNHTYTPPVDHTHSPSLSLIPR